MGNGCIWRGTGWDSRATKIGAASTQAVCGNPRAELFVIWSRFMTFSIKATIRAFAVPKHRLNCPRRTWQRLVRELERRGERRHESGAFLLGVERGERREVR